LRKNNINRTALVKVQEYLLIYSHPLYNNNEDSLDKANIGLLPSS